MSVDLHYFSQTSLCLPTTENNAGFNSPQQNTSVEYCIFIEALCCGKFYPHRIYSVANKTKSAIKKANKSYVCKELMQAGAGSEEGAAGSPPLQKSFGSLGQRTQFD